MQKLKAFATALLLGLLTVSVANAQAGKSKGESSVTPEEAGNIGDWFYRLVQPGARVTESERIARKFLRERERKGRTPRRWSPPTPELPGDYFTPDDPSADGGH